MCMAQGAVTDMNDDILTLQETLAHQSMQIEQLSDALYAQQKDNTAMRKELDALKGEFKRIMEMASSQDGDSSGYTTGYEPPPPHY